MDSIEQARDELLFFHEQGKEQRSPARRLLAAILIDARACLAPGALVHAEVRAEALAWIEGELESAPLCSFREVCAILNLGEERTRAELLDRHSAETGRRRMVA